MDIFKATIYIITGVIVTFILIILIWFVMYAIAAFSAP